eukprot:gene8972-10523_t
MALNNTIGTNDPYYIKLQQSLTSLHTMIDDYQSYRQELCKKLSQPITTNKYIFTFYTSGTTGGGTSATNNNNNNNDNTENTSRRIKKKEYDAKEAVCHTPGNESNGGYGWRHQHVDGHGTEF